MSQARSPAPTLAVIGGGPAGLMAAETARAAGLSVDVYEAKGSVGRKFLIAGKGGMNLTHSEPRPGFDARYRERAAQSAPGWTALMRTRCATGRAGWAWRPSSAAPAGSFRPT